MRETEIRVCYADVDQMGFVYYGNYLKYYEIARNEALRSLGMSYRDLEAMGVMMPVLKAGLSYRRAARYDDLIRIRTIVGEMPKGVRMDFDYAVYGPDGSLLNTGFTQLAFMRSSDHRPCPPPEKFLALIRPFFSAESKVAE